jgi:hypothetical protein
MAAEYDIPTMPRVVDIWLADHAELALPPAPPLGANLSRTDKAYLTAQRDAAACRFARMLGLASEYKLKRFAEAAKVRVKRMSTADLALVVTLELDRIVQG